jgi:hypothetical protein
VDPARTDSEAKVENRQKGVGDVEAHNATISTSALLKDKSAPLATRWDTTHVFVEAEDNPRLPSIEAAEASAAEVEAEEEDGMATERTVSTLPRATTRPN